MTCSRQSPLTPRPPETQWGPDCLAEFSVWIFKVGKVNLDLFCDWQMGQKRGPMVCDMEKGVSEVAAGLCLSFHNWKMGTQYHPWGLFGELNEKRHMKHSAQCLILSSCSINVSLYYHEPSFKAVMILSPQKMSLAIITIAAVSCFLQCFPAGM